MIIGTPLGQNSRLLGDVQTFCKQADDYFKLIGYYAPVVGWRVNPFNVTKAGTAAKLLDLWYRDMSPIDACDDCFGANPAVCDPQARAAIVRELAAFARRMPNELPLFFNALIARALNEETKGEPLRAWMDVAGATGSYGASPRVLWLLLFWAGKSGRTAEDLYPKTRATALAALTALVNAGMSEQLQATLRADALAIQADAQRQAQIDSDDPNTGTRAWNVVEGQAAQLVAVLNRPPPPAPGTPPGSDLPVPPASPPKGSDRGDGRSFLASIPRGPVLAGGAILLASAGLLAALRFRRRQTA